jgi:hypothetical protein
VEDTPIAHYDDVQSLDATLALLNDHRRHVVDCLAERECPVPLESLAEAVATREADADAGDARLDGDEIASPLHHTHLPKLAAAGVVEYDAEERTVLEVRRRLVVDARNALAATLND